MQSAVSCNQAIFSINCKEVAYLNRAGHTEAGHWFPRLAGCEPASVIVWKFWNEDGKHGGRQIEILPQKHQIKLVTIADLIEYRQLNETPIEH